MKYRIFESWARDLPAFNLNDVRKFDPSFHRQQLTSWQKGKLIKPLAGGYYILADKSVNEDLLFLVANKLYEPSYVSLESALAYYRVIPESVLGVTSVSSLKTKKFESAWGIFNYRSVKPLYMFGYLVIDSGTVTKYRIANLEKAVLDYLYLNPGIQIKADFEGLRWNKESLQGLRDNNLLLSYLEIFNKRALDSRIEGLMEYLNA